MTIRQVEFLGGQEDGRALSLDEPLPHRYYFVKRETDWVRRLDAARPLELSDEVEYTLCTDGRYRHTTNGRPH